MKRITDLINGQGAMLKRLSKESSVWKAGLTLAAVSVVTAALHPIALIAIPEKGLDVLVGSWLAMGGMAFGFYALLSIMLMATSRVLKGKAKAKEVLTGLFYAFSISSVISFIATWPSMLFISGVVEYTTALLPAVLILLMVGGFVSLAAFISYVSLALWKVNKQPIGYVAATMISASIITWVGLVVVIIIAYRTMMGTW